MSKQVIDYYKKMFRDKVVYRGYKFFTQDYQTQVATLFEKQKEFDEDDEDNMCVLFKVELREKEISNYFLFYEDFDDSHQG